MTQMILYSLIFLQNKNFQLQPLINKNSTQQSFGFIFVIVLIGILVITAPVILSKLRKRISGVKETPRFNKENFYNIAKKSGLGRDTIKYLYQHVRTKNHVNPMKIFFNYTSMVQIFKAIYEQEKSWKKNDPVKFQENIALLIDAIDTMEEHFQSVSVILNTFLIPPSTKVFLSDLENSVRIPMSVNRSTARALVLNYKCLDKKDDAPLRKTGKQLTLWLLDSVGSGYAAYNVKVKKIRSFSSTGRKEYYLSHSWRQEVPNITRKHKRVQFAQQGHVKLLSPPPVKNKPIPGLINILVMDISLGGCSLVVNPKYQEYFSSNQKLGIRCPNPFKGRSGIKSSSDPYLQLEGHITRVTTYSGQAQDGLCNVHVKFGKLERLTKNQLGLFIYGLENIRLRYNSLR